MEYIDRHVDRRPRGRPAPITRQRARLAFAIEIAPVPLGLLWFWVISLVEPVSAEGALFFAPPLVFFMFACGFGWMLVREYATGLNWLLARVATVFGWFASLALASAWPVGAALWLATGVVSAGIAVLSAVLLALRWWPRTAEA